MLILDTNHLRVLQTAGSASDRLANKLRNDEREPVTTIINVHEAINGWLSEINRATTAQAKVPGYAHLLELIEYFSNWTVLPFDTAAAAQFDALKRIGELRKRGTMDLQIAAIALCHNATVLTRNLAHFQGIPSLRAEDWLLDAPLDNPPTV
jgi:tRNA(fMet)-specific endonuclease VapC